MEILHGGHMSPSLPAWWLVPVLPSWFLSSFGSNYIFFQCFWWLHLNVLHDLCFICLKNPKHQISPGPFQLLCNSPLTAAVGTSWWLTDDMYCRPLSLIPNPDTKYHFLDGSGILETELFSPISFPSNSFCQDMTYPHQQFYWFLFNICLFISFHGWPMSRAWITAIKLHPSHHFSRWPSNNTSKIQIFLCHCYG